MSYLAYAVAAVALVGLLTASLIAVIIAFIFAVSLAAGLRLERQKP